MLPYRQRLSGGRRLEDALPFCQLQNSIGQKKPGTESAILFPAMLLCGSDDRIQKCQLLLCGTIQSL